MNNNLARETTGSSASSSARTFLVLTPAVFVVLWATGFIGAKFGMPYAPPLKFLLWRFLVVIVLMGAIALATRAAWPKGVQFWHVALAGVLLQGGYLGGVFVSIDLGMSAGLSALIVSLQPILTAVAGPLYGERVTRRQWVGFLLGLGGVALVVSHKLVPAAGLAALSVASVACAVLALLSITAGTIYQRRYCGAQDLRTQSVVQFIAAGLVLLPLSLLFETRAVVWNASFVFAVAWLVIVLSLGAISLLFLLIRRGAATQVSSLMYLVPPVTAVIAWIMFDEVLQPQAIAGMVVAVAGVALVMRPAK